jgi:hypothetical protein
LLIFFNLEVNNRQKIEPAIKDGAMVWRILGVWIDECIINKTIAVPVIVIIAGKKKVIFVLGNR